MKNEEKNWGVPIALAVAGIFEFCYGTIVLRFWEMPQLWGGFVSSLLGAVITVCITALLLNQQTKQQQKLQGDLLEKQTEYQQELLAKQVAVQTEAERDKERFAVLFTKKAKVYDKYIAKLYKSVQDSKVDVDELRSLQDGLNFRLQMYLDDKSFDEVGAILEEMNKVRKGEKTDKNLKQCGVDIVAILHRDLETKDRRGGGVNGEVS